MNLFLKNLINANHSMILLESNEVYKEIFNFLEENFKINYLKIYFKINGQITNIFNNSEEENHLFYTKKMIVSNNFEITFGLIFLEKCNLEDVKKSQDIIDLALKDFSHTLYTKYLEKKVKEPLIIDPLTQCYNRTYLNHYIKPVFSLAQRENKKIAFLKVGVDHFKAVLDEFNYDIGDKVIKKLSTVLKDGIRDSDLVVRMSNDAFLVILQNIAEEENALLVANKLIDNFKKEKVVVDEITGQVLMKTICIGITIYPKDGVDLDTIIKKSDIAVREAKNHGRSRAFVFSEEETSKIELF